jgi:hypothetical protein
LFLTELCSFWEANFNFIKKVKALLKSCQQVLC